MYKTTGSNRDSDFTELMLFFMQLYSYLELLTDALLNEENNSVIRPEQA